MVINKVRQIKQTLTANMPKNVDIIRNSSLYNEAWYLEHNPDVNPEQIEPALHYFYFGGFEGRDPGPYFSSRWYLQNYPDVANAKINPLYHYLCYGQSEGRLKKLSEIYRLSCSNTNIIRPIDTTLIYQMGKVGSRTVVHSLETFFLRIGLNVDIYHAHNLNKLDELEANITSSSQQAHSRDTLAQIKIDKLLRSKIDLDINKCWDVISLVRDPVARNVGSFFHDYHAPRMKNNIITSSSTNIEYLQKMLYEYSAGRAPFIWFDEQFKPVFNIDVFNEPFPKETGYKIYKSSKVNLLLIRLEDLNRVGTCALAEFLDVTDTEKFNTYFKLINTNIGDDKEYADLYQSFKKEPLSQDYIEEMYASKYARHFYTDDEIKLFKEKWSGGKRK